MKVKIGNKTYDGKKEPIMIILTDDDKKNIAAMDPKCTKYCEFPDDIPGKKIMKFMEISS